MQAVSRRCEIKKVNPHALRHTFATRLVEENVPLNTIQNILGHASISTTQKYMHGNVEYERDAIDTMSRNLDIGKLFQTPQLNGAKKRGKFADVTLPDFAKKTIGPSARSPKSQKSA